MSSHIFRTGVIVRYLLPETAGGRKAGTPPWARSCRPGPGCSGSSPCKVVTVCSGAGE